MQRNEKKMVCCVVHQCQVSDLFSRPLSDEIDFAVTLGIFSGVTGQVDMLDIIEVDYDIVNFRENERERAPI